MSNNVSPTVPRGGEQKVNTTNDSVEELLERVVSKLDILIKHQECITDIIFNQDDIEGDD